MYDDCTQPYFVEGLSWSPPADWCPIPPGYRLEKGYVVRGCGKRTIYRHREVWEAAYGPIPPGMVIHHIDHDRCNNRLDNLAMMDRATHNRIHAGCVLINGVWYKSCSGCRQLKPLDPRFWYYQSRDGRPYFLCKPCYNKYTNKKNRRLLFGRRVAKEQLAFSFGAGLLKAAG